MDDVFSAIDKTTEEHIFASLFGARGLLADATVILATNSVHRLPSADHILIIDEGTVKEQGSFSDLSSRPGALAELMQIAGHVSIPEQSDRKNPTPSPVDDAQSSYIASMAAEANEEVDAEMAAQQANRNSVLVYLLTGGRFLMIGALILMVLQSAMPSIIPVYIQAWTTAVQENQGRMLTYMGG